VTEEREERAKADALKEEQRSLDKEFEKVFREQLDGFAERISKTFGDSESAKKTADGVANELARLRRLMQAAGRAEAKNTH